MSDYQLTEERGPVYGVQLIDSLRIGTSELRQAMPSRRDLAHARQVSERVVAGYEVLLAAYLELRTKVKP